MSDGGRYWRPGWWPRWLPALPAFLRGHGARDVPLIPMRRDPAAHELEGNMDVCEPEQIDNALWANPPRSNQQLMVLALEEMRGRDRAIVYRILAQYKR